MVPFVYTAAVLRHEPGVEVWVGKETAGTETPRRAEVIRSALLAAGHPELPAEQHDDDALLAVHDAGMLDWLRGAAARWAQGPYLHLVGQDRVVPYVFPTPAMTAGMPWRHPAATHALAGLWCYDTMTAIGPGTWPAARAAVDAALTAADLVAAGRAPAAYALCRPPGHHAAPAAFGGSCYLNNAAIAAQSLARTGRRVAVIDVDAHHGNGTQAVFWDRPDVFYGSVHVDPGAGWFPHVNGYPDETGGAGGLGATLNLPLPPGAGDAPWLAAIDALLLAGNRFRADALVVSLGVDAAAGDPESPLQVSRAGYREAGRRLAEAGLPTVLIQEGGYCLSTLGDLVADVLAGFRPWSE